MNKNHRILKIFTVTFFIFLISLFGFGLYGLYDVLHPPRRIPPGTTLREENIPFQEINLMTEDGIRLTAWYTPPRNGAVILLAHGYGDNRPEWVHALLAKKGYGVLAWDARAHGESDGEISTLGYQEILDVEAALDFALAQEGVEHVGAWGGSMGGATMIRATAQFPEIEALIIDSSFASLEDEVDFFAPYPMINPLAKLLLEIQFRADLDEISQASVIHEISPRPVYIIHGGNDTVAPVESAEILFNSALEPKSLWIEEDAIHLGIHLDNPPRYQRRVIRFFDEWLLGK
jgi:fermentation-respiration switch protein FrsA (DUF1100 family)